MDRPDQKHRPETMPKGSTSHQIERDEWPNTVRTEEELNAALASGERSGVSPYSVEEVFEQARERVRNG